jgi:hypothetical protein
MAFSDLKDDLSYGYENNRFYSQSIFKGLAFLLGAAVIVAALASGFGALGIGAFGATAAISTGASFIGVPSAMGAIGSLIGVSSLSTAATLGVSGLAAGIGGAMMYPGGKYIAQKISNKMARDFGDQKYKQDLKATKEALKKAKAEVKAAEKQAKQEIKEAKNQYQKDYKARHDILDKKGIFGGKDRTDKLLDAVKSGDPVKITKQINKLRAAVNGVHLKDIDKIDPKQAGKSVAAVTKALDAVNKALTSDELNPKVKQDLQTLKGSIETKLNTAAADIGRCDDSTKKGFVTSSDLKDHDSSSNLSQFSEAIKTSEQKKSDLDTKRADFQSKLELGSNLITQYGSSEAMVEEIASFHFPEGSEKVGSKLMREFTKQVQIYENQGITRENAEALTAKNMQDLIHGETGSDIKQNIQDIITPKQHPTKASQTFDQAADILAGIGLEGVRSGDVSTTTPTNAQAPGHGQGANFGRGGGGG